jgi:hypothetical protein
MGTTAFDGPLVSLGSMENLAASFGAAIPSPNPDAGPCIFYKGDGIPDPRFFLQKAKLNGYRGVQPSFLKSLGALTFDAVPAAYGTAKIAALQNVTNATAMTLVTSNTVGIAIKLPIAPFSGAINGAAVVTAPVVLDFGFAIGICVSGTKTFSVPDATPFYPGMPLVIATGNSSAPVVLTIVTATNTGVTPNVVTVNDTITQTGNLQIGTGDIYPGAPLATAQQAYPIGHLPYLAGGPGLFADPAQMISRGVSITASASASGGNFVVSGWDVYWQPMTETIASVTNSTVYGKKAFKAIKSVTPAFTDAHNYSVGTSDVFGFNLWARRWELTSGAWAGGFLTGNGGFTGGTAPASGDVRGTLQVSAIGGGTGYGSTASNGAITGSAGAGYSVTGNRLTMFQSFTLADTLNATPTAPQTLFGATQT